MKRIGRASRRESFSVRYIMWRRIDSFKSIITTGSEKPFFALAMVILAANCLGWALHYTGHRSVFGMMSFIATLPPLYDVAKGLRSQYTPSTVNEAVFLALIFLSMRWKTSCDYGEMPYCPRYEGSPL